MDVILWQSSFVLQCLDYLLVRTLGKQVHVHAVCSAKSAMTGGELASTVLLLRRRYKYMQPSNHSEAIPSHELTKALLHALHDMYRRRRTQVPVPVAGFGPCIHVRAYPSASALHVLGSGG